MCSCGYGPAGDGPPLLLIHGHPRTSATWHRVAPQLITAGFTVVCPDMRGYGRSSKPIIRDDHRQQAKRAVADDLADLMSQLDLDQFAVVGHDRGGHVAFRLAMDYPSRVTRLVIIDAVPIIEALERCDARVAERRFDWFFFAQPETPERVISADPVAWYRPDPYQMGAENYAELVEVINDPETGTRHARGLPRRLERRPRGRPRRPARRAHHRLPDARGCGRAAAIWRRSSATRSRFGRHGPKIFAVIAIDSGHHMAEENPGALVDALTDFLADPL